MVACQDPQTRPPCCFCDIFGCELHPGDAYYDIGGVRVCADCLPVFARRYFASCARAAEAEEV